jgi:adenine-specific DNA-methyltransferase
LQLSINRADNQRRRFVLIEMKPTIAREITAERLRRVAQGYKISNGEEVSGLGFGFRFATLGEPLFDERGNIRKTVRFPDLARHVYFTETGEPLPDDSVHRSKRLSFPLVGNLSSCEAKKDAGQAGMTKKAYSPLIGICNGIAVYLLYNGILKDKTPDGGNVLTTAVLADLPKHDGPKVIYGTACRIGPERLRRENITFKQLPYKIKVM